MVAIPTASATSVAGSILADDTAPAVMVSAPTEISVSIAIDAEVLVSILYSPVDPDKSGFLIFESVIVFTPATDEAPSLLRVIVIKLFTSVTVIVPSIPLTDVASVVPFESITKPLPSVVGKYTTTRPSAGIGLAVVNVTVAFPVAPATSEAGSIFVEDSAPVVMVSAVTEVFCSRITSALVFVYREYVPVEPGTAGFFIFESVMVFTPAADEAPSFALVRDIVFELTDTVNAPSIPVAELTAVVPPELYVNPEPREEGSAKTTFKSVEKADAVVKVRTIFPVAPASKLACSPFVEDNVPSILSAVTVASISIVVPPLVVVFI